MEVGRFDNEPFEGIKEEVVVAQLDGEIRTVFIKVYDPKAGFVESEQIITLEPKTAIQVANFILDNLEVE